MQQRRIVERCITCGKPIYEDEDYFNFDHFYHHTTCWENYMRERFGMKGEQPFIVRRFIKLLEDLGRCQR